MTHLLTEEIAAGTSHPIPAATTWSASKEVPALEHWMTAISAFMPVYQNGNATLVLFEDGASWYVPWSVASMYHRIAFANLTSKSIIRRQYEREMGSNQNVPLVCQRSGAIYPAFKFRFPLARNDGATTYVKLAHITKCEPVSRDVCCLQLSTGFRLQVQMRFTHVEKRIRDARHFYLCVKYPDTAPL